MDLDKCALALAHIRHTSQTWVSELPEYRALDILLGCIRTLDNEGVFATIDGHTGYASAEDILTNAVMRGIPPKDPAEWGDSTGYVDPPQDAIEQGIEARRHLYDEDDYTPAPFDCVSRLPGNHSGPSVTDVMFGKLAR